MRKIIFILFVILSQSLYVSFPNKTIAVSKCEMSLVEDGGADKWSPPSTKSTNIWFTVKINEDYVESFSSPVNAYISFRNFESVPIYTALGVHADFTLQDTDKVYIRGIHTDKAGAGTYYQGAIVLPEVFKWRSGSYKLTLVKSGDKISNPYCTVPFEVKPYCEVALTPGMDFKPPLQLSFKVVDFFPYDKGGIDATTEHNIFLNKEGETLPVQTLKNRAGFMKNPGISFPDPVEKGDYQIKITNASGVVGDDGAECKSDSFGVFKTGGGVHPEDKFNPTPTNTPLSQPCTDPDPTYGCLKINTALGDVGTRAPAFVTWVLGFVLGISGGIVLIIIIITGYRLMTSQGDPEKVKNAREQLTAAIVGLLFIIFSLVILQLITQDILRIPGFGG